MKRKGFTLVELMIVILIIGILTTMAVPMYRKTIETSKATDALAILNAIANANRMYNLDTGNYANGEVNSRHVLVRNKYMADHPWASYQWKFCACNTYNCGGCGGGCGGIGIVPSTRNNLQPVNIYSGYSGIIACAYNDPTLESPYNTWKYKIDDTGKCHHFGIKVPPCPKM